jgi:neutral ceramidase
LWISISSAFALEVGYGKSDLPIQIGKPLGGYFGIFDRKSTDVLDAPQAIALVLSDGNLRVAIVSMDILIIRKDLRDGVLRAVRDLGIQDLLLVATHTHSGPGGYIPGFLAGRITGASWDSRMLKNLIAAAASAIRHAVSDLTPVTMSSTLGEAKFARNRSQRGGPKEIELPALRFDSKYKTPILLFSYGAHPTMLTRKSHAYSADYVGWTRMNLEKKGWRPIFLPGPLGNQRMFVDLKGDDQAKTYYKGAQIVEFRRLELLANQFSETVDGIAREAADFPNPHFSFQTRWVDAPGSYGLHPKSMFRKLRLGAPMQKLLSKRVPFQKFEIGNVTMIALPAEPATEIGDQIRKDLAASIPIVLAHANDWLGYAVTEEAYEAGKYEAAMSFFGPGFGKWLVTEANR